MAQSKINQTHHTFCATTSAKGKFVSSLDQALMNAHRGKTSYANTTSRMCTSLAWWRVVCRLDAHLNMDENRGIRRVRFMGLGCRHTWRIMSFIAIHRNCSYCTPCTPVVRHDHGISWLFSVSRICTCVHEHIKWETDRNSRNSRNSQLGAWECLSIVSSVLFLGIELAISSHVVVTAWHRLG